LIFIAGPLSEHTAVLAINSELFQKFNFEIKQGSNKQQGVLARFQWLYATKIKRWCCHSLLLFFEPMMEYRKKIIVRSNAHETKKMLCVIPCTQCLTEMSWIWFWTSFASATDLRQF
jgi:hypothetical protein